MQLAAQDLGVTERLKLFSNGQEVLSFLEAFLDVKAYMSSEDPV